MLFFLTGLFTGCSENEEDYPKGQRPAGIESVRKVHREQYNLWGETVFKR